MQSQELHETFEKKRVCSNSDTENGTPTITGKDTFLISDISRYNAKKSFGESYNTFFHVYFCRVNKFKENCGCSSRRGALSEDVEKFYKDCNFWNTDDDFSQSQNGKAKIKRNFGNTWGIRGLISSKQGKETKYPGRAKPLPTWCENVTILNNNPTRIRIAEPRLSSPVPANGNDNLAINEISNLLTYLKGVNGENCKKTENWPQVYIPILEKCLHCEKEMALERNKKMRNHKNISTKLDPNIDMFLTQPKRICKKNKYVKGFCGRMFLRQEGSTTKSCCSKKEKNTNTYITCFEKLPTKSCVIHKKITFTPNKRVCKKSCSLNLNCNYITVPKYFERNQMPCKKHLFMENMNKFLALNTLLEEKTANEKAEILKCLANNGVCLPAAKTKSEKKIFNKVQKELRTCKRTDRQQHNDYCKSMKVDFLKPFRCKSYNISTSTLPHTQFIDEDNCELKCGRGIIKSSPIINNNNEKIYEILPPPSRRLTVKGKIRNDFIKAMGRIKLKKVKTDNGDLNLLRTCSKKEKGLWSLIKNNCRSSNRGVMASLLTPNDENCDHSSYLNKTRQYCPCDVKKHNENHSIIKIELSPYIYPLDEDENGNTKRILYNNKNVKVTIGRVKVQSMWQLKYFKNLIGKSNTNKLPSTTTNVKRTYSLISEKPCRIDYHQNTNTRESYESKVDWTKDISSTHAKLKNYVKSSEIRDKSYFVLPMSQSAVDLKRLDPTSSCNITTLSELTTHNSQLKQLEVRENSLQKFSRPYNLTKSIIDLNLMYPAVYFKTKSKVKCKNHIRLIPLGRSSTFLNSRSFAATEVRQKLPTNNNKKEKHFTTNVFVISTNTKEYRSLNHNYYNQYEKNHLQERQRFTPVNAQPSNFRNSSYFTKCDIIQDQSYEPSNFYIAHNTKQNIFQNFELDGIDSGNTLVVSCNAKFENCFHVLETLTGVQRECCIINQATEKRIRFDCPDETTLRENRGYTELSAPNRRTRHAACIRDDDSEYSKYRVLDPVLSLENSISKFKNRIETTLKKCREKRRSHQTSPSESTSSDNLKLDDSSELGNKGILKQHENDIIISHRQMSPAESRNKGILKMNEHGDKKDYSEISPSPLRNRSILKPHEHSINKMDSQTSPIDIRNRGIVKLPKQNMKKLHCIPLEPTNRDIVKQQERNIKKRYRHTSPPESRNRGTAKVQKHNKKEIDSHPLNLNNRDVSKLHEKDDNKKDSQTSLDTPNRGEAKMQGRDIIKKEDQSSVPNLKGRPIAKRHRHNIKKKDSQTSPLDLRNTDTAKTHNAKLTDSQTSPLNLNQEIIKLHEQNVKKKDSQTSPIDLRNHCIAKAQDHDVKMRDSQSSPLDLTKKDPAVIHNDDVKKRDSQTSPLDVTKKYVSKLHSDDIIRRDSQTSPLDLTKRGVVKLAKEDIKKIDSQTSPLNLKNTDILDDREKPLWPKSKEYQYRQKAKYGDSFEPERKDNQYRPKAKYEESYEPERKDYQYRPKAKFEESYEPERKDCLYWPKPKSEEPFEPEGKDYQNQPKAKYEEPFKPDRRDYQHQPKAKYDESLERNDNQYRSRSKCEELFKPARNDYQYQPTPKYDESLEPERNDYQYRPKAKHEESFTPDRKDYQYRPKTKYQESCESGRADYQNRLKSKLEESFKSERNDYQHRPKTKHEESYEPERNDYQNPKVQHEKSSKPEEIDKYYQDWSNSEDEVSSDPEDEENRFWPKMKNVDHECDSWRSYPEGGCNASFGPQSEDNSCRPKMKCIESFGSKCEDFRPMKRKCDKENSIIECFKRASRRRVSAQREQCEQRRKISSCLKQPNNKRKLRGRRFRWKCKGSEDNILTNLVKRSKCHFERISCNPRSISQKPRPNAVPQTPRIVGCRKTIECPPIQYKKRQVSCDKDDYTGGNKKPALTYSDFKVFTNEELQWIISNCSDAVLKTSAFDTNKDEMTSEEETKFYCDYASMFKDCPSDDCDWEGIRFQVRPNNCASKKWWCMLRTIF